MHFVTYVLITVPCLLWDPLSYLEILTILKLWRKLDNHEASSSENLLENHIKEQWSQSIKIIW